MDICNRCDKEESKLQTCVSCNEKYCEDCLVEYDQHRMIDFCFCKDCDELSEILD